MVDPAEMRYTSAMRWPGHGTDAVTMRLWDGVLLFWVMLWVVVGAWTGYLIFQLTELTDSVVDSGRALRTAGGALEALGSIPLIGERTGELGREVTTTADGIVASGGQARESVRGMSILIGLAVALGPTGPALLFYLPARLAHAREARAVARWLRDAPDGAALRAYLAGRAVVNLTASDLRRVSQDPHGDLAAGRHGPLARAELRRLGVRTPETAPG
jgi:hypothetical protein